MRFLLKHVDSCIPVCSAKILKLRVEGNVFRGMGRTFVGVVSSYFVSKISFFTRLPAVCD